MIYIYIAQLRIIEGILSFLLNKLYALFKENFGV